MSSGGKSLVPRGGLTSTTPSASPFVEAASPWVSVDEDAAEEKRRQRLWMWRREKEPPRQVGLRGKRGRRRRRWRSDGGDDHAAIDSTGHWQIGSKSNQRGSRVARVCGAGGRLGRPAVRGSGR